MATGGGGRSPAYVIIDLIYTCLVEPHIVVYTYVFVSPYDISHKPSRHTGVCCLFLYLFSHSLIVGEACYMVFRFDDLINGLLYRHSLQREDLSQ